jgi:shikimate kinase
MLPFLRREWLYPSIVYGILPPIVDELISDRMAHPAAQKDVSAAAPAIATALGRRSIVLVGMMGSGKSSIGRRLATRLGLPFADADTEIEAAAGGMTIPEIFAEHGEPAFRSAEARVIARLLDHGPQVLATGGGAFMDEQTRMLISQKGVSVWLKADPDVLLRRIRRRSDRPMLQTEDPVATLHALLAARTPTYALADLSVQSRDVPHEAIVDDIVAAVAGRLAVPEQL